RRRDAALEVPPDVADLHRVDALHTVGAVLRRAHRDLDGFLRRRPAAGRSLPDPEPLGHDDRYAVRDPAQRGRADRPSLRSFDPSHVSVRSLVPDRLLDVPVAGHRGLAALALPQACTATGSLEYAAHRGGRMRRREATACAI